MSHYVTYPDIEQITLQRTASRLGPDHDPSRLNFTSTLYDAVLSASRKKDGESDGPGLTLHFHDAQFGGRMLGTALELRWHLRMNISDITDMLQRFSGVRHSYFARYGDSCRMQFQEYICHDMFLISDHGLSVKLTHQFASAPDAAQACTLTDPRHIHLQWEDQCGTHRVTQRLLQFQQMLHAWAGLWVPDSKERSDHLAWQLLDGPDTCWPKSPGQLELSGQLHTFRVTESRLRRLTALIRSEPKGCARKES